jgi:protein gp37
MPGLWLGVTAENQARADERIPILLQIPAALRFVSCEPLLGPVDLNRACWGEGKKHPPLDIQARQIDPVTAAFKPLRAIDWIIVGGETGPGARPMHPDWVRSLRDQCQAAGVLFFFKSWGQWTPIYTTGPEFELSRLADDEVVMSGPGHGVVMKRVGKKAAGRLLDGREWNEIPD